MLTTPVPAIDVHTHLFPERLARAVRNALHQMYGWTFDISDDPETFAAYERARGIERFCVLPYAHKPGMARSLNEWVAKTCSSVEGAIGFACVNQDDEDPAGVLADAFALGLRGLKLHHQVQHVAPDDERLGPIYAFMVEQDAPLIVHAGRGPTDSGTVGVEAFARAMQRWPDLRVCVAHMGAPEVDGFVDLLDRYDKLYLDTSGLGDIPLQRRWLEARPDRILFGSDAPNINGTYDMAIARITSLDLGEQAERAIFRDNAERFLRL